MSLYIFSIYIYIENKFLTKHSHREALFMVWQRQISEMFQGLASW
jgi:hypothetical protein